MKLKSYCEELTRNTARTLITDEELGRRIMCPEYAIDHIDVKTFPTSEKNGIFILCWILKEGGRLCAAIQSDHQPYTYQCEYTPNSRTQYHTHDYIELAYIIQGEFKQRIMGKDILFKQGELCLIDRNCPHQDFLADGNSMILFIGLANESFDQVMVKNIGEENLLGFLRTALMKQKDIRQFLHFRPKKPEDHVLEEQLLMLLKELQQNDVASKYICKGLIIRILHYISTMYEFSLSHEQRKKMNWLVYEEISRYIEENYAWVTVRELVSRFHFNEDYYSRILKEKLGMTYLQYVQDIRLKNARQLLLSTDMTVDEVAVAVGYQNKGYFYKIFLEKFGMTPSKMRKFK